MQTFSGLEYMYIALTNSYGYDKLAWTERISWGKEVMKTHTIEAAMVNADEPILFAKYWREITSVRAGNPSRCLVGLDATASGIQLLGVLTGCSKTAEQVNLAPTGVREDVYTKVAMVMNEKYGTNVCRDAAKKPIMTTFYGSVKQPESVFGEATPELAAFYATLQDLMPGAMEAMHEIQSCWQGDALAHSWSMPDGHHVYIPNMVAVDKKVEIDNLANSTFTHRAYFNEAQEKGLSLAANVVHSVDALVVREMIRRANKQGFTLLTIHDSFQ